MAEDYTVGGLMGFAITFIIVAIAISLGADVLTDIKDTQKDTTTSFGNQSLSWAGNNTAIALASDRVVSDSLVLYNDGTKVNKGVGTLNYTVQGGSITIINQSDGIQWNTSYLNSSYDYKIGSSQRNITEYGLQTQDTLGRWLPTIAMVIALVVVIGVLIVYLANRYM